MYGCCAKEAIPVFHRIFSFTWEKALGAEEDGDLLAHLGTIRLEIVGAIKRHK